jgi:chromosome segregation ATPase
VRLIGERVAGKFCILHYLNTMNDQSEIEKLEAEVAQLMTQLRVQHQQLVQMRLRLQQLSGRHPAAASKRQSFSLDALRSSSLADPRHWHHCAGDWPFAWR